MLLTLESIEQLTSHVTTFWFTSDKRLRFIAGQYIEITVPHTPMDNRGDKRWMTISSSPSNPRIAITMKFARPPHKSSTYKQAFRALKPGAVLYASDPIGDFVLPKSPFTPLVFMALGIGITPVESMMLALAESGQQRTTHIVHGGRTIEDLVFRDHLENKNISTYTPLLLDPPSEWPGQSGYLTGQRLLDITHNPHAAVEDTLFYMSGPEAPVLAIIDQLYELGIKRHQIAMDYFPGYILP